MTIRVEFKKLRPDAIMPSYAHKTDSGADVYCLDDVELLPNTTVKVPLGFAVKLPPGWDLQMRSRSGLSLKGVHVLNSPGTIDTEYVGEICAILHNVGPRIVLPAKSRVAQLILSPVYHADYVEVAEVSNTSRGAFGFGSTGS
jgi:dUTP pyrophosphatase